MRRRRLCGRSGNLTFEALRIRSRNRRLASRWAQRRVIASPAQPHCASADRNRAKCRYPIASRPGTYSFGCCVKPSACSRPDKHLAPRPAAVAHIHDESRFSLARMRLLCRVSPISRSPQNPPIIAVYHCPPTVCTPHSPFKPPQYPPVTTHPNKLAFLLTPAPAVTYSHLSAWSYQRPERDTQPQMKYSARHGA